jgi:membrane protein required for colicin V production
MNILDVIFAVIAGFLLLRGLYRGLLIETASLLGAVAGFFLANKYHLDLADYAKKVVPGGWAGVVSYLAIFFAVVVLVTLMARGVRNVLTVAPGKWLDRLGGGAAGLLKGVLICLVVLVVLKAYFPEAGYISGSRAVPYLNRAAEVLQQYMPEEIKSQVQDRIPDLKTF